MFPIICFSQEEIGLKGEYFDRVNERMYKTIKIGDQIWMAEDLKASKFRNGDVIPWVIDEYRSENEKFKNLKTPAICKYDNVWDPKYGHLYNIFAVNDPRGLAPDGWRIANKEDFRKLLNFINYWELLSVATEKIVSEENEGCQNNKNFEATNSLGFSMLANGRYFYNNNKEMEFAERGCIANYWLKENKSYVEGSLSTVRWNSVSFYIDEPPYGFLSFGTNVFFNGLAVRCIKE